LTSKLSLWIHQRLFFFRDRLYECPLFAKGEAIARWQADFRRLFNEIPDDTTLQIVDAHS
jgi:hypothetical protein